MSVLYRALSRAAEEAEGAAAGRPRRVMQRVAAAPRWSIGGVLLLALVVIGVVVLRSTDQTPLSPGEGSPAKSPYLAPPLSENAPPVAPSRAAGGAADTLPEVATVPRPPAVTAEPLPPAAPPQQAAAPPAPSAARGPAPANAAGEDAFKALQAGRLRQALAAFDAALAQAPEDPRLLAGKADALRRLGRREPALQAYQAALRLDPGNEAALAEMMRLIGNRPRQALERLLDIHAAQPDDPGIAAQVGMIYVQLGELSPAMDFLRQALAKRPDHAVYVFNLGVLQDRLGHRSEAIELYSRALQLGVSASVPKAAVEERLRYLQALGG